MMGPQVPFCEELHATKYRSPGENFREAMNRVASALSDGDDHFYSFRKIISHQRFMPAGRIQAGMGALKNVTQHNCYVSGTIEDSFVDGHGSIMDRAKEAAATMRMGGGIGYDFSTLRPNGAWIKKLQSQSSGPVSFMQIFDAVCRCIASSGHRRGAQMGVLRVDHPDIEEFIHAKQNQTNLTGFNVSVAATDEFMRLVRAASDRQPHMFPLKFDGQVVREVNVSSLWETIMRGTWDWAEPGVLFIDTINRLNNLWYCEKIAATNPCGEQPLPPYGACLLGSFNLVKYLKVKYLKGDARPYEFNFEQLAEDIPHVVRAMDNVVDRAVYPMYEQEKEAKSKRRMGLGVTGLANALEAMDAPYGGDQFLHRMKLIFKFIMEECYKASVELAKEKGPFPLFNREDYLDGEFVAGLSDKTRDAISEHGIRNSHLISIAPTGTISLTADNVSSGIEPVFAHTFDRLVTNADGTKTNHRLQDYGMKYLGVKGKTTNDVTLKEHLDVLIAASQYVDSAVSKTCNVPPNTPWHEFKNLYIEAWASGCKGCTTFNIGGKRFGILNEAKDEEASSCRIDLETGRRECE